VIKLIEDILNDLRHNTKNEFSYARYYRNRGDILIKLENAISETEAKSFFRDLKELEKNEPKIPENLIDEIKNHLPDIKINFISIFLQSDSYYLLWLFNAIKIDNKSLLSKISQEIYKLSAVTRGGINIYKRNGWMIHVLYGYQLINYNMARGCPPDTIDWPKNTDIMFKELKYYYNKLTSVGKIIINIGYFLHDIGVIDSVQNHSKNGPNHVPIILKELNIKPELLKKYDIHLDYFDLEDILKILVEYHTLINRVGGEYSDKAIADEMIKIKFRLSRSENLLKFFQEDFLIMIMIIGIADLIAVDDYLINFEEYKKILLSFEFIQSIINGKKLERPIFGVALSRIKMMVKEKYFDDINPHINCYSKVFDFKKDIFIEIIYNIYKIEYGVAALKPMDDPRIAIKILFIISKIIKYKFGVEQAKSTHIIFDSSIDVEKLKNIFEKITPEWVDMLIKNDAKTIYLDKLEIMLASNSDYNLLIIKTL
jgi:hypothetical protein